MTVAIAVLAIWILLNVALATALHVASRRPLAQRLRRSLGG